MARPPHLAARDAALLRLKRRHSYEFDLLYDQERVERGLKPLGPRREERLAQLEKQLERLRRALEEGG